MVPKSQWSLKRNWKKVAIYKQGGVKFRITERLKRKRLVKRGLNPRDLGLRAAIPIIISLLLAVLTFKAQVSLYIVKCAVYKLTEIKQR